MKTCPEHIYVQVNANGEPYDHRWFEVEDDRCYNEEFVRIDVYLDALARLDAACEWVPIADANLQDEFVDVIIKSKENPKFATRATDISFVNGSPINLPSHNCLVKYPFLYISHIMRIKAP